MPSYPNVEAVLCDLLADLAPTVTFRDPEREPPYVFVRRTGGSEDGVTDRPTVRVEVLHHSYAGAQELTNLVRQRILSAGCTNVNGVLIDTTDEITAHQVYQYFDPDDRNITSTYRLSFRKQ